MNGLIELIVRLQRVLNKSGPGSTPCPGLELVWGKSSELPPVLEHDAQ